MAASCVWIAATWVLGAAGGGDPWGASPASHSAEVRRVRGAPPRYLERHDTLMEAQDILGMWQRESREFVEEAEELERLRGPGIQIFRGEPADPPPDPEPEVEVEAPPPEDAQPTTEAAAEPPNDGQPSTREAPPPRGDNWLEEELARREASRQAALAKSKEDEERERLWNEAAERRAAERNAAIEAEARRMQEALNRARRREEEKRARQLGGALDKEGNYVDPDLEEEEEEGGE